MLALTAAGVVFTAIGTYCAYKHWTEWQEFYRWWRETTKLDERS